MLVKEKGVHCQNIRQKYKMYRQKTQTFYIKYRQNTRKNNNTALHGNVFVR